MKSIMYHYIHPLKTNKFLGLKALDLNLFIEQLNYLQKEYQIIDHNILVDCLECNKKLPERSVILTFDDGYRDMYKFVFPELVKRKIKGLFYVPNYFHPRKILDINIIHLLLVKDRYHKEYLKFIERYISNSDLSLSYHDYCAQVVYDSRYDSREVEVIKQLLQFLLPQSLRSIILSDLLKEYIEYNEEELFNLYYCSQDELSEMISIGMHIGGHGNRHLWMNKLSKNEQEVEVSESLKFLKTLKEQKFYSFSYPYGGYDDISIQLMDKYNFKFAFTTELNSFNPRFQSKYEIPRYDANDVFPNGKLI